MVNLEKILKLNQEELLDFNYIALLHRGYRNKDIIYTNDYVYAKGNIPILLVAHCDIVHKEIPEIIVNDKQKRILWSPTGIGGDDRCGVYAILKICEKFKPYVLFTTDEEIGGVGVRKFVQEVDEIPVNFIIEIDRRGNEQVVFYECDNKEFQNYIVSFGFDKQYGSYSDVSTLSTHYDIAGCNVSAGYYREHTKEEHIFMEHLENTIDKIKKILSDTKNHKFYKCEKKEYKYEKKYANYYDYYGYDYDDGWYWDYKEKCYKLKKKKQEKKKEVQEEDEIEQIQNDVYEQEMLQLEDDYYALTKEQWKEKYGTEKPKDIIDLY